MNIDGKIRGLNNMCKISKYHGQLVLAVGTRSFAFDALATLFLSLVDGLE
jgi:hypothetical protein